MACARRVFKLYFPFLFVSSSSWNLKQITVPKYGRELAEFVGIVLGDGNIYSYKGKNLAIRVSGDSRHDALYLREYVAPLVHNLFSITPAFYQSKRSNCLHLLARSKLLVEFFNQMGIKSGNKTKNQSTIPSWIYENEDFLKACVRGLIDTDGSVYEMLPHWPGLFQIYFGNKNLTLLNDLRKSFLVLDYNPSNITNLSRLPCFYLTRKSNIVKYSTEVGFHNLKHSNKLKGRIFL